MPIVDPVVRPDSAPSPRRRGLTSVLTGEAVLVGGVAAGFLVDGMVVVALGCLALAALAAGLATSIDEGFPAPGAAVLAFQGTGATIALLAVSAAAALLVAAITVVGVAVLNRRRGAQIRRPVPAQ